MVSVDAVGFDTVGGAGTPGGRQDVVPSAIAPNTDGQVPVESLAAWAAKLYVVPPARPLTTIVPQLAFVCQTGDAATEPFACTKAFTKTPPLTRKAKNAAAESPELFVNPNVVVVAPETLGVPGVDGGEQVLVVMPEPPAPNADGHAPPASFAA